MNDRLIHTNRRRPSQGVKLESGRNTIVFVTVCTKDRMRWLACPKAHGILRNVWQEADAWLVGRYVLMPDHLHLFASPYNLRFTIEAWCTYWKRQFSRSHQFLPPTPLYRYLSSLYVRGYTVQY